MCSSRIDSRAFARVLQIVLVGAITLLASSRASADAGSREQLAAPEDAPIERARRATMRGETLFAAQNYEAALAEFAAAYRLLEGDPRQYLVLHNMAVCHERLFRYDLALELYARYLAEGGSNARDRREIERVLESLRRLLGRVHIDVDVAAEVWIDTRRLGRAPGVFLVPAGNHTLELRAPLYESVRRPLAITSGSQVSLKLTMLRLSRFTGLDPAYFWTSAAVTLGALGVAGGFGLDAVLSRSSAEARARRSPFLNTVDDQKGIARSALIADVGLGAAAVFGALTIVLYSLMDGSAERADRQPSLSFAPAISTTGAWQARVSARY